MQSSNDYTRDILYSDLSVRSMPGTIVTCCIVVDQNLADELIIMEIHDQNKAECTHI